MDFVDRDYRCAVLLDSTPSDRDGFCNGYSAGKHRHEHLAEQGIQECRSDWEQYIGPIDSAGGANPRGSCFTALTLPTVKPERIRIISYIFECQIMPLDT